MTVFKKIFVVLAMIGLMIPSFAFAATSDDPYGFKGASEGTNLINTKAGVAKVSVPELIGNIIAVALSFVGAIFFILILYAGFLWMTAFGAADKVDKAKDIILHAAIGLVIVVAAYAISTFVFGALAGATGGQGAATGQADTMGCCFNPTTNNRIQNLESQCVPSAANPRIWTAGPC